MENDEHQWENEGGQVKPEPVDDKELGGESCSNGCSNDECQSCLKLFGPLLPVS